MSFTWLHISDFHFMAGDPYDRDVVLRALLKAVKRYREEGRVPNVIFATGDIANSGQPAEYDIATNFFDELLKVTGLNKTVLFLVPGNHDVDLDRSSGLSRTLQSREDADEYFGRKDSLPHLSLKQHAFVAWFDKYFAGIRSLPALSTCGQVENLNIGSGETLGVLPINSALFAKAKDRVPDHEQLWIGRRCLDRAVEDLKKLKADINIALLHHPLYWLHPGERPNIKTKLQQSVDFVLRGHLHETEIEHVVSPDGQTFHMAAGAAYDTRQWPNRALYCSVDGAHITIFPIRYEDSPGEVWVTDPSVFPYERGHEKRFSIPRLAWIIHDW